MPRQFYGSGRYDESTFGQLKRLTRPLIEAFEDDLLVHDKAMIEQHKPGTPFLHYTRACGTHMFMLIPADEYPRKGESVPFLFGYADRDHLLQGVLDCVRSIRRRHETGDPEQVVHHFDGQKLRRIDDRKAVQVAEDYARSVRHTWDQAERRCDPVTC